MRNDTPPSSPFFERNNVEEIQDDDDDDELIYVGDAEEVLNAWEAEGRASDEDENDADDARDLETDLDEEYTPSRDDSVLTFAGHEGPVFCGSLHPSQNLAVTGGEDDKAFVWSTETGNVMHVINGHKDSVTAAEFSADGNYVATGDMAGFIQVHKLSQDYKSVWEFEMGDMSWMQWHASANVLMAGADAGETYVWRIPSGECKVLQGNGNKSEVGTLMADGKSLIVGYSDGSVKMWDLKSSAVIQEIEPNTALGHSEAITSIAAEPNNGRFLTGGEDGKIVLANSCGPLCNLFPNAGSVEALAFCTEQELKLVACGTLQGKISLWDINRQAIRMECKNDEPTGITKILWAPKQTLLCATLDGSVRAFDGRDGEKKVCNFEYVFCLRMAIISLFISALQFTLEGHAAEVYDIRLRKSTNELLTTSEDKTAKIFKLDL